MQEAVHMERKSMMFSFSSGAKMSLRASAVIRLMSSHSGAAFSRYWGR